ncbi:MAG TPA: methyltransferase domain-containing protein [Verrucomicrobiae bacterium]|nr:methyltransferase domain-containing protein [Verrucomicrobiae bacterium]
MVKYILVGGALKVLSQGAPLRKLYRAVGNVAGGKQRAGNRMPATYLDRIKWKVDLCQRFNILKNGDTILELGTGWVHWEALTLRLFYDISAVLYDVWDNRQLSALKSYIKQLDLAFDAGYTVPHANTRRARELINEIQKVASFEELYSLLDFRYVLDPAATLNGLPASRFQLVVSAGVFEHVRHEGLNEFVSNGARLVAPGGFAMHSINIADHLAHYDQTASPKQYLSFSEGVWKRFFENELQYINRVQRSDWLKMFDAAGLILRDEIGSYADLAGLKINNRYASVEARDLQCTNLKVLLQK